jgi:hypothetical protein
MVVRSLFDQMITFRHKELVAATKAIHDAEKRLGGKPSAQLDEARQLAFSPAVDEKQIQDVALLNLFKSNKSDAEGSRAKAKIEEEWAARAKANYARAIALANSAK